MKLNQISVFDDGVQVKLDDTVMMFGGRVEHTIAIDRTGRLDIALSVVPQSTEPRLRAATPNRNPR